MGLTVIDYKKLVEFGENMEVKAKWTGIGYDKVRIGAYLNAGGRHLGGAYVEAKPGDEKIIRFKVKEDPTLWRTRYTGTLKVYVLVPKEKTVIIDGKEYKDIEWIMEDSKTFTVVVKKKSSISPAPPTKKYPKASIVNVKINGKSVKNGGSITIQEERARVTVSVKNIGNKDGTIVVEISGKGIISQRKETWLLPNSTPYDIWFDIEIPEEGTTLLIRAGHYE